MFKYERLTNEQIQLNLDIGIKQTLLTLLPLDYCHLIAAGCMTWWYRCRDSEGGEQLKLKLLNRCLVISSDKMNLIIVYEERPSFLGGPRAAAFEYNGPGLLTGGQ